MDKHDLSNWHVFIHYPSLPAYDRDFTTALASELPNVGITCFTAFNRGDSLPSFTEAGRVEICEIKTKVIAGIWFSTGFLSQILAKPRNAIVVLSANPRDISTLLLGLICRLLGRKVVFWGMFHSIGSSRLPSAVSFFLMGLLGNASATYGRTGAIAQLGRGISPSKIAQIGTAIEPVVIGEKSTPISKDVTILEELDRLRSENSLLFSHVMRLSKFKNIKKFLQVCETISGLPFNACIIVVGAGEMDGYVQAELRRLGIEHAVFFAGPVYDKMILNTLYSKVDATLVATCIGLTAHQSLMHDVIVITDDSIAEQTSEFEILRNSYNALVYEENNFDELRELLIAFEKNRELGSSMKKNIPSSLVGFRMEEKVQRFTRMLESLISK